MAQEKFSKDGLHIVVKEPLARSLRKFASERGLTSTSVVALAVSDFVRNREFTQPAIGGRS